MISEQFMKKMKGSFNLIDRFIGFQIKMLMASGYFLNQISVVMGMV